MCHMDIPNVSSIPISPFISAFAGPGLIVSTCCRCQALEGSHLEVQQEMKKKEHALKLAVASSNVAKAEATDMSRKWAVASEVAETMTRKCEDAVREVRRPRLFTRSPQGPPASEERLGCSRTRALCSCLSAPLCVAWGCRWSARSGRCYCTRGRPMRPRPHRTSACSSSETSTRDHASPD